MEVWSFLKKHKSKNSEFTITSLKGGKWNVPPEECDKLYKLIIDAHTNGEDLPPLTETIGNIRPLVIDMDIKYTGKHTERQYSSDTLKQLHAFLWSKITEVVQVSEDTSKLVSQCLYLTKTKPYPCNKSGYSCKDGIHLLFPNIVINETAHNILSDLVQSDQDKMFDIFSSTSTTPPSNLDDTLFDAKVKRWMPYLCHKENEEYYKLEQIFEYVNDESIPLSSDAVTSKYTIYTPSYIIKAMSMLRPDLKETHEYSDLVLNKLKATTTKQSSAMVGTGDENDIYTNYYVDNDQVINPFKIVEENQLKYVRGLVKCLSEKRATEYNTWLNVGFCLYNINSELLPEWKEFSSLSSHYDPESCDKQWKQNSKSMHDGPKFGIGSLVKWAKEDNIELFEQVKRQSVECSVHDSVVNGTDADFLIAGVIHKYFENEYISMNVKDEWYYFNGVRWEKTLEGTTLRMAIHKSVWKIYHEYEPKYRKLRDEALDKATSDDERKDIGEGKTKEGRWLKNIGNIKMKLLKDSYVTTLMNSLRNLFYKKDIAEKFDANVNLLGFDNGVIDLKEGIFREGRPEDYVTTSCGYEISVGDSKLPIPINQLSSVLEDSLPNYKLLRKHLMEFIKQIIPIYNVRQYTLRFLSKCLSGENRDEGFYIWTGSGGNGKSKLIELMQMVLGSYAGNLPVSLITSKRSSSNSATPEMERTKGLRFVFMQEPEAGESINIGLMKELTGNDKIQARGLFKEPIEFVPQFKLLLMCNDLPNIPSNDDGTWRRLEVVDFISRFIDDESKVDVSKNVYKRDKCLRSKLQAWPQVFLCILLEEWLLYDKEGIKVPSEVSDKTKAYRNDNDIVGQWIDQACEEGDNVQLKNGIEMAPTSFADLFFDYSAWCKEQGYKPPDKKKTKDELLKWQEKSKYGLSIGKKKSENLPNGSERAPSFNLIIVEEEQ